MSPKNKFIRFDLEHVTKKKKEKKTRPEIPVIFAFHFNQIVLCYFIDMISYVCLCIFNVCMDSQLHIYMILSMNIKWISIYLRCQYTIKVWLYAYFMVCMEYVKALFIACKALLCFCGPSIFLLTGTVYIYYTLWLLSYCIIQVL